MDEEDGVIALDTNILIRLATGDDAAAIDRILALLDTVTGWVSRTVLLEVFIVLEHVYKIPRQRIVEIMFELVDDPRLRIEGAERVIVALEATRQGLSFQDALHVASTPSNIERFATLDKKLVQRAPRIFDRPTVVAV